MRIAQFILTISTVLIMHSCTDSGHKLPAREFLKKVNNTPGAQLVDVREEEEFTCGHIRNAINIPWNRPDFIDKVSTLDKSKTVFLCCLTGGRSDPAAEAMKRIGFRKVYELEGGMLKWRVAGLPQEGEASEGITRQQFDSLISGPKSLVVFKAVWNKQSQKLLPLVEEISRSPSQEINLVPIDVDKNQALTRSMNIDAIPTVRIYRGNVLVWQKTGCTEKEEILKNIP